MALTIADQFSYKGKKQNFARDGFDTLADMKNYNENYLPDVFHAVCYEDGKMYLFNRANTIDAATGKWREVGSAGASSVPLPPVKNKSYYYGVSATDTGIDLSKLTKKSLDSSTVDITVSATSEYVVFAMPKDAGNPNIYDDNGLNYTSSFICSTVNDGTDDYYLYVSDSEIFCVDFIYKIKY